MLKKIITKLKFSQAFLAGSFFIYLGSMVVNVSNYLFHLILGRSLGPAGYGVMVSLISLLTVLAVPSSAISTVATKFASDAKAKNHLGEIKELLKRLSLYLIIIGFLVFIILVVVAPYLANYLNISAQYIRIIAILILFAFLIALNRGVMQGLKMFKSFSINTMIEPLVKIAIFFLLFYLGLQITSAIWAMVIATIIAYIFSFLPLKSIFQTKNLPIVLKKIWHYSFYTLLVFLFLSLISYLDVLLVKHYFSSNDAGLYASLSTLGKIVLYISMPIITVMFPFVSEAYSKGEKHYQLLAQTFLIICGMLLVMLVVYKFAPNLIVGLLFGQKFLSISPYLFIVGVAYALLSLDYMFIYYYLSIKNVTFIWFLLATLIIFVATIYQFHQSIAQIIYCLIFSFGFLLLTLAGKYIYSKRLRLKEVIS